MSVVDNYILVTGISDDDVGHDLPKAIIELNETIAPNQHGRGFLRIDHHAGGYKAFEADAFAFAGNCFGLESMAAALSAIRWSSPEEVGLLHRGQYDEAFRFYQLSDLKKLVQNSAREIVR